MKLFWLKLFEINQKIITLQSKWLSSCYKCNHYQKRFINNHYPTLLCGSLKQNFEIFSKNFHYLSDLKLIQSSKINIIECRHFCDRKEIEWDWEEIETDADFDADNNDKEEDDDEYQVIKNLIIPRADTKHNLYVIQPIVKWGRHRFKMSTPEFRLNEAVALVHTLPEWKVRHSQIVNCDNFQTKYIFTSGTLERLTGDIKGDPLITAAFVAVDILQGHQQLALEQKFGVPIFDRYSLILEIFKLHAKSREAKIQVSLAEISYLKARVKQYHEKGKNRQYGFGGRLGGSGESYVERTKQILERKSLRLKAKLKTLSNSRELLKKKRIIKEIPTIAVIGYTNSGKTSLIKALTQDSRLIPRNVLFATLDITTHAARLPSFSSVLFIDTVGFISNIPTTLIEAFNVTLREAVSSSLIIHVYDASHEDLLNQLDTVKKTINLLSVPDKLISSMITVGNKIDLVDQLKVNLDSSDLLISATKGINLEELVNQINSKLVKNTDRMLIKLRIPNGGKELTWLYKESTISEMEADKNDNNFLLVKAFMTRAVREKFKSYFDHNMIIKD